MAKHVKIKFGGGELELRQSETLVAVRPRPGRDTRTLKGVRKVEAIDGGPTKLAGFDLVRPDSGSQSTDQLLASLRGEDAVAAAAEVFHTSDDEVPFVPTGQVYVRFKENAPVEVVQKLLDDTGLAILERRDEGEFILQATPTSGSVLDSVVQLQNSDAVEVAEPELATFGALKAIARPNDELLADQWHLENRGEHYGTNVGFKQGADARVTAAWDAGQSLGSRSVIVAVIDDGFDLTHHDLGGPQKVVAPRDFTRNGAVPQPDWRSEDWHGTACAGVAVGEADNRGVLGAAPGARLMPIRWGPDLADSQIEQWFAWAAEQGASVVSCSWGAAAKVFRLSERVKRAITKCAREGREGKGIVICFAAGNSNRDINNPPHSVDGFAIHPDVIAVAASNSRDQKSSYSNFGREIWVCAPSSGAGGWGIVTADVSGTFEYNGVTYEMGYEAGPYTRDFGGTSSACPLVAGICALILSANPDLTADEVRDILKTTARKIQDGYDANGHSTFFGYGCVNAEAAVVEAIGRRAVPLARARRAA